jgi:hypothetical protein
MTVVRTVRPTDLVALVSFDGRVYPNEAKTRERIGKTESAPHPLESALEQWFSFATGRHTWISVKGATLRGLVSARRRGSRAAWELDCLINAAEDDDSVCLGLLDQAVAEAARRRVEKVFLRLAGDSSILPFARKAGFSEVMKEQLFSCRSLAVGEKGTNKTSTLRKRVRADDYSLFQLYNAVVPEAIRRAEAATLNEWRAAQERNWLVGRKSQLILERDERATVWLRSTVDAGIGRFDLLIGPEARAEQEALLDLALSRLAGSNLVLTLVPDYADGLGRALVQRGFQPGQEYSVLVKRTAVAVKGTQLAHHPI